MPQIKDEATPIRRQYLDLKRKYADCILFFRLGDFFETFDADAELLARELDVYLTSRPIAKDTRIPMAGVPHHAAESYIARLIEKGYRVAVADQLGSEPVNGLVPREVRRVVTPGTVVEPSMLDAARPSYLAAWISDESRYGFAYCDITTGEFYTAQLDNALDFEREMSRVQPREVLRPDEGVRGSTGGGVEKPHQNGTAASTQTLITKLASYRFELSNTRQALLDHFQVGTLAGFGIEDRPLALRAAGAIVAYLRETQPSALRQLAEVRVYSTSHFMGLDAVTRRNLELVENSRTHAKIGSLLGVLDKTTTPMGARLLRIWISQPLLDRAAIDERLARVDVLFQDGLLRARLREQMKSMPDLERLTGRVVSGVATPKDLLNLKAACDQWMALRQLLRETGSPQLMPPDSLPDLGAVIELIHSAIKDEPDDDGFIKPNFSPELDGIHHSSRDAKTWVANLERLERDRTGIRSLKVGYNKVFGYYIEITHANKDMAPSDYIRKQTLTNAERYITPDLKEYETLILNADERVTEVEARLLQEINTTITAHMRDLMTAANIIARVDVAATLAEVAARNHYTRPQFISNAKTEIEIVNGRHPVIEQLLHEVPFTPNDTCLDDKARILVITGPNMSGKSSYMRQVALIVLMAQIGSYVPAEQAKLGLVDRVFTRIGAQDELTAGQSTFMVEMVETAHILRNCTPRSLVILDEIGRGTSTYDGLAIAWSVIEYLHNHPERRSMTLFATHYHELIQLADVLPQVRNYNVAVSDEGGAEGEGALSRIVFLHKLIEGGADRSYGVHVGQLAGLPQAVVRRAQDLLKQLETGTLRHETKVAEPAKAEADAPAQFSLFADASPAAGLVVDKLKQLDPNSLSPIEALTALYELKKLIS